MTLINLTCVVTIVLFTYLLSNIIIDDITRWKYRRRYSRENRKKK